MALSHLTFGTSAGATGGGFRILLGIGRVALWVLLQELQEALAPAWQAAFLVQVAFGAG